MDADTVSPLNIPAWRGFPLRSSLADALGLPVVVDNDAKALALAEGWIGAASGVRQLPRDGRVDGCRRRDRARRPAPRRSLGQRGSHRPRDRGAARVGGARAARGGASRRRRPASPSSRRPARRPRWPATRSKSGPARLVGRAVASVASLLDLDLAVVGGSVALGFGSRFFDAAQRELSARARLSFSSRCRVTPVGLGELAPARRRGGARDPRADVDGGAGRADGGEGAVNVRHHTEDGRREHATRTLSMSARAIARAPASWWPAVSAASRFAPRGWWRRPPFLPAPDVRYWRLPDGDGLRRRQVRHRTVTTWPSRCAGRGALEHADGRVTAHGARAPAERDVRAPAARH